MGSVMLALPKALQLGFSDDDVDENNRGSLPEYKEPLIVMRI